MVLQATAGCLAVVDMLLSASCARPSFLRVGDRAMATASILIKAGPIHAHLIDVCDRQI